MDAAPSLPMRGSRPHGAGSPSCISCFLNLGAEGKPQTEGLQRPRPRRLEGRGGCTQSGGGGGPLTGSSLALAVLLSSRRGGQVFGHRHGLIAIVRGVAHGRALLPWGDKGELESLGTWRSRGRARGRASPWLGLSDCDEFAFPVGVRAGLPFLQDYHCRTPKWDNTDTNNT